MHQEQALAEQLALQDGSGSPAEEWMADALMMRLRQVRESSASEHR